VVAFTDTDCVADPHWLAALPRKLDAAARIVGTGGRVKALFEDSLGARYNIVNRSLEPQETLSYLVTCNCCYLREPLLEAGGFMEDIRSPGGEDIAASIALWKRGWRFVYEPDALVYHEFRNSLRNFVRTWINYGYGCALVAHRLLTREELWPELGRHDAQNYWCVLPIRPDVTGVRSFLRDQYHFFFTCGKRGVPVPARMGNMFLRAVDRVSYYHGWRKGLARFRKEGGTVHMLS
jgi:GT2 family glycosyltransferase